MPAADGLAAASIEPLTLTAKEGLALINGTDGMLGMLLLALHDLERLLKVADDRGDVDEALLGTDRAFAADLIEMRPQPGQQRSAANLTRLLAGSAIVASHRYDDPRVQDAYSPRCAPQVNGATRDACAYAQSVAAAELKAAIDNPVVMPDGRVESCGNFHGAPVALACDFLAIAAAELGAIASAAPTACSTRAAYTGCRRSSPRTPGSTRLRQRIRAGRDGRREPQAVACPRARTRCPRARCRRTVVTGCACKLRTVLANVGRILAVEPHLRSAGVDLRAPLDGRPAHGRAA